MSLLNAWISPTNALVAFDTKGLDLDGTFSEMSKAFYLPHSNVLVGGRGTVAFTRLVFHMLHLKNASFDEAVDALPLVLSESTTTLTQLAKSAGVHDQVDIGEQEILLVGWSKKSGRIQAVRQTRRLITEDFESQPVTPWSCAPYDQSWGEPPVAEPNTLDRMEKMAAWQVRCGAETFKGAPLGGRLMIADLTRDGISIKTQCNLGLR